MKRYFASDEIKDTDNIEQTIVYSRKHKGYIVASNIKLIELVSASSDDYLRLEAGEAKHLFPQFDPETHYISYNSYDAHVTGYDNIPVKLMNKIVEPEPIPYGSFIFEQADYELVMKEFIPTIDNYIDINNDFNLDEDFKQFRESKSLFKKLKQKPRKGVLLYGPPGNGKTIQICKLAQKAKEEKFRLFFITSDVKIKELFEFKKVLDSNEGDNVFIIEEITERVNGRRDLDDLLSFLDGELSWNNSYVIATTNHPEELPWNIIDRPTRFKLIKEVPNPNETKRRKYFEHIGIQNIDEAIAATKDLSLDYIKNITFDSIISNKSVKEVVEEYKKNREKLSKTFKKKIGMDF